MTWLTDGRVPNAWKLIHAARRGGDRFSVGSGVRYAFGQASDAANKAKEYSFESLHKIYFYDAWRWRSELDQPDSPLRLPPQPGLLQNGCYWPRLPRGNGDGAQPRARPASSIHEVSLTESSSAEGEENPPPSETPEPASQSHAPHSPTSPITIGSTEEEQADSQKEATEPSESESHAETIVSASCEAAGKSRRADATLASPATNETSRISEQRQGTEEAQAEESESGTTDEVIDLDNSSEAIPDTISAPITQPSPGGPPTTGKAAISRNQAGVKRPAPATPLGDIEEQNNPPIKPKTTTNMEVVEEGGHPCGSPLVPPNKAVTITASPEEQRRRSRWAARLPAVSAAPPQGVDPESQSTASQTIPANLAAGSDKEMMETDVPQPTARPKMQGPLAVKSKVTKPAEHQQERASEQNMIDAIQSRLNMPPRPEAGLISIAASRPIATVAGNPQMPEATPDAPKMHAPNKEEAPTTEIFLEEAVDADITHLAEQRAMHTVFRFQTLAVQHAARASPGSAVASTTLPPVAPAVSLYANLPQEWPLARLSVQLRHIGVLLRVTLFRRVAELNFRGVEFRSLPREVMTSIIHDFNNIGGELARPGLGD